MEPTMTRLICAVALCALLAPVAARAQTPATGPSTPPPARPPLGSRFWIVAGGGFAAARAGCPTCDREGVFTRSKSLVVDVGMRMNPRVDAGIELAWVSLKVNGEDPIRTTFVLGAAQMRPWVNRGLVLRAGMGIGIAGNGLQGPIGPELPRPYTTNALAVMYGTGWVFRPERRWTMQVYATHYVAALGTLTTIGGSNVQSVVGNYWTVGAAVTIRSMSGWGRR
jgi:hypothetical protein